MFSDIFKVYLLDMIHPCMKLPSELKFPNVEYGNRILSLIAASYKYCFNGLF